MAKGWHKDNKAHSLAGHGIKLQRSFARINVGSKWDENHKYPETSIDDFEYVMLNHRFKGKSEVGYGMLGTQDGLLMSAEDYYERLLLSVDLISDSDEEDLPLILHNFSKLLQASEGTIFMIGKQHEKHYNLEGKEKEEFSKKSKEFYHIPTDQSLYMSAILNSVWHNVKNEDVKNMLVDTILHIVKREKDMRENAETRRVLYSIKPWGEFYYDLLSKNLFKDPDTWYKHFHRDSQNEYLRYWQRFNQRKGDYVLSDKTKKNEDGDKVLVPDKNNPNFIARTKRVARGVTISQVKQLVDMMVKYYDQHPEEQFGNALEMQSMDNYYLHHGKNESEGGKADFKGLRKRKSKNLALDREFVKRTIIGVPAKNGEQEAYIKTHYKKDVERFQNDWKQIKSTYPNIQWEYYNEVETLFKNGW